MELTARQEPGAPPAGFDDDAPRPHVVVIVRYSILTAGGYGYSLADKLEFTKYRKRLFAPKRLEAHERLFDELALPSLAAQTMSPHPDWFSLLVLTSTELPASAREALESMVRSQPWATIVELPPDRADVADAVRAHLEERFAGCTERTCYMTTRLDDDDALTVGFFADLRWYIRSHFAGFAISPAAGYAATVSGRPLRLDALYELDHPKAAQGLSFVGCYDPRRGFATEAASVFDLGHHLRIDNRVPTLLDSRRRRYIRTLHEASTQSILLGRRHRKRYAQGAAIDPLTIRGAFVLPGLEHEPIASTSVS